MQFIDTLDIEREKQRLGRALSECRKAISVRMEAATSHNLIRMLAHGVRALHYTGHGFQQCLAFEDGKGMMHSLTASQLKELFTAGIGTTTTGSTSPHHHHPHHHHHQHTASGGTASALGATPSAAAAPTASGGGVAPVAPATGVQFVFVSACHSETAANAFVDAGVPHVIAVKLDAKVGDTAAHIFMDHFYFSLFVRTDLVRCD